MEALPIEIGVQILTYAITDHPTPISSIAVVHSSWAAIVLSILHKNLIFKNLSQLIGFAQSYSSTGRSGENHHLASIADNAPEHSGNRICKAAPSPCTIFFLPSITTTDNDWSE
ncbi:hypothetical protein FRC02_006057 [Tulasnella sp. 418]|nr:hypothetical protein FRC02_006057 [Tulasnella sp. 418]